MHLFTRRTALLAGAALMLKPLAVFAGGGHCHHCRCQSSCKKYCRLVYEEKKVEIICWGGKCEDFCLPGPSKPGCKHCEIVCDDCNNKEGVITGPKRFVWYDWIPGCSNHIRTKNKLMKKIVTKKVPSYKWVVEDLCGDCRKNVVQVAVPADAEIPAPPAIGEALQFVRLDIQSATPVEVVTYVEP